MFWSIFSNGDLDHENLVKKSNTKSVFTFVTKFSDGRTRGNLNVLPFKVGALKYIKTLPMLDISAQ